MNYNYPIDEQYIPYFQYDFPNYLIESGGKIMATFSGHIHDHDGYHGIHYPPSKTWEDSVNIIHAMNYPELYQRVYDNHKFSLIKYRK